MANPGILRQYLEDYAAAYEQKAAGYTGTATATDYNAQIAEYNKTVALDAAGNQQYFKKSAGGSQSGDWGAETFPDTYQGMTKHDDGNWYVDGPSYAGDSKQLSAVADSDGVYLARQGGTPQYAAAEGADGQTVTGYTYPTAPTEKPAEFSAPATPEFTMAQAKQISNPTAGQAMSSAARGGEGVIARYLGKAG